MYLDIIDAFKSRFSTIVELGTVHAFLRWTIQPNSSEPFGAMFKDQFGRVNTLIMTRTKYEDAQAFEDNKVLRRHTMDFYLYLSHLDDGTTTSELDYQNLIEIIETDLRTGDRTLGGKCLTYSLPDVNKIGHGSFGNRKDSYHTCTFKIEVDEVL